MKAIPKENLKAFLKELSALTRKHKISISGCGCCGSPYLQEISDEDASDAEYEVLGNPERLWWG